jgi:hypothetical protein
MPDQKTREAIRNLPVKRDIFSGVSSADLKDLLDTLTDLEAERDRYKVALNFYVHTCDQEKEIRDKQIALLVAECDKRGVKKMDFDEYVVGQQTIKALNQPVTLSIRAGVEFSIYNNAIPKFTLEFRCKVETENGGWSGYIVPVEKFDTLDEMFKRAAEAMVNPFVLTPTEQSEAV